MFKAAFGVSMCCLLSQMAMGHSFSCPVPDELHFIHNSDNGKWEAEIGVLGPEVPEHFKNLKFIADKEISDGGKNYEETFSPSNADVTPLLSSAFYIEDNGRLSYGCKYQDKNKESVLFHLHLSYAHLPGSRELPLPVNMNIDMCQYFPITKTV